MNCPQDGTVLAISERNGIEIDYCPQCRGVWLDRGELDKILDRAGDQFTRSGPPPGSSHDGGSGEWRSRGHGGGHGGTQRRRGGWLGELFD